MTWLGASAIAAGAVLSALGFGAGWVAVAAAGIGLLIVAAASALYVLTRPSLELERAVEPPRVQKGSPAIAVVHVTNRSRRSVAPLLVEQRLGETTFRALLPRLRRGEQGLRTYRLPTSARGVFYMGPLELPREDPFGLFRTVAKRGAPQRIEVHPRLIPLSSLPTGVSRILEGPSSDSSPSGTVTFHRLREYVVGDDLRLVHWPSTARTGKLVVRHNVDTAEPFTVVLLDLSPKRYSAPTFEEAVDIAASVVNSMSAGKAPVQLRTSKGDRLGGPGGRDPVPLVDFLTTVSPDEEGSLEEQLTLLRRDRGGTALVIVTGVIEPDLLPDMASLRRRFDRVIAISVVAKPGRPPVHAGLRVVETSGADEMARIWNQQLCR